MREMGILLPPDINVIASTRVRAATDATGCVSRRVSVLLYVGPIVIASFSERV